MSEVDLPGRLSQLEGEMASIRVALSTLTDQTANQIQQLMDQMDDFPEQEPDHGAETDTDTRISFWAKITGVDEGSEEEPATYDWEEARWNAGSAEMEVIPSSKSRYSSAVHGKARDANEEGGYEVGDFVLITRVITNQNEPQPWQHIISRTAPADEHDWSFKVKVNESDSSKVDVTAGNAYIFNDSLSGGGVAIVSSGNPYIVFRVTISGQDHSGTIKSVGSLNRTGATWDYVLATMSGGEVVKHHQMGDIYDKRLPYWDTDDAVLQVDGDWQINNCLAYTT